MKHMSLKELVAGQRITGYYILQSGKTGTTSEGAPYYCATMLDGSGTMDLRCWQNANNLVDEKTIGEIVYLEGDVKLYRETQQICCQLLRPANGKDAGEYELSQLLPTAKSMREDVAHYIAQMVLEVGQSLPAYPRKQAAGYHAPDPHPLRRRKWCHALQHPRVIHPAAAGLNGQRKGCHFLHLQQHSKRSTVRLEPPAAAAGYTLTSVHPIGHKGGRINISRETVFRIRRRAGGESRGGRFG